MNPLEGPAGRWGGTVINGDATSWPGCNIIMSDACRRKLFDVHEQMTQLLMYVETLRRTRTIAVIMHVDGSRLAPHTKSGPDSQYVYYYYSYVKSISVCLDS